MAEVRLRVGAVLLAVFAIALAGFYFLENDTLIAAIRDASEKFSDGSPIGLPRWLTVPGLGPGPSSTSAASRARSEWFSP